jgi:ribose 5-phosphate isomerase B
MTIHLATDHAGFQHKEALKQYLIEQGIDVVDHGAAAFTEGDDYPDFITPAAQAVAKDQAVRGIIFGHSGQGEAMCANRVPGARAVVYYGEPLVKHSVFNKFNKADVTSNASEILRLSRAHNDANILSIGTGFVAVEQLPEIVSVWLNTPFSGEERHVRRLNKF